MFQKRCHYQTSFIFNNHTWSGPRVYMTMKSLRNVRAKFFISRQQEIGVWVTTYIVGFYPKWHFLVFEPFAIHVPSLPKPFDHVCEYYLSEYRNKQEEPNDYNEQVKCAELTSWQQSSSFSLMIIRSRNWICFTFLSKGKKRIWCK